MKDLIVQVSEVAATNGLQAALKHCCSHQAVSAMPAVKAAMSSPGEISAFSPASQKNLILRDINDLLPLAAEAALQVGLDYAKAHIYRNVAVSFSALACPDWTPEVVGTGAAIAARHAALICAKNLVAEVK
jgi:hypothetical protein